jgi:hypothetical protein
MAADGSIIIDTKIDEGGVNKGVRGITRAFGGILSSVKGIGKAMAGALLGGAVINAVQNIAQNIIGSFDLMNSSIGGSIAAMNDSFSMLSGAFINLIATALAPLIPYIITVIQWLTTLFTTVTQIIAALFGMKTTVGGIAKTAAGGAGAAKKAAKDAQGALASFDQINVLQKKQEDSDAGGGGGAGGGISSPPAMQVSEDILKKVQAFKDLLVKFWNDPIGTIQEAWGKFAEWFRTTVIERVVSWLRGSWAGNLFLDLLNNAVSTWKQIYDNTVTSLSNIKGYAEQVLGGIRDFITGIFTGDWGKAWQGLVDIVFGIFNILLTFITGTFTNIALFVGGWAEQIRLIVGALVTWFVTNFGDRIRLAFNTTLDFLYAKFAAVFGGIQGIVKSAINGIIDGINRMLSGVATGLNTIIRGANVVNSFIPGGSQIGYISAPQIPRLATGAVIPPNSEFMAILGDQRSGRNIEAPEGLIRQIISEEMGKIQADIQIGFSGSMAGLVRELKPYIDRESVRVGGSLLKGGAAAV